MKPEDALGLCIPVMWVAMLLLEALFPRRHDFPVIRGWRWLGALGLLGMLLVGGGLPLLLPAAWTQHHLLPGDRLGLLPGVLVGYLTLSFCSYAYHRACHRFDLLWRWSHQVHHSATRLDMAGATLFHPFEMVAYTALQVGVLVFVLGLAPVTAAATGTLATFYSLFQHLNVRTPVWLGYFIQRPESHGRHHELGVHAFNYSDLPLWDWLFGTFSNPATHTAPVGFGRPIRPVAMLLGRDVSGTGVTAPSEPSPAAKPAY